MADKDLERLTRTTGIVCRGCGGVYGGGRRYCENNTFFLHVFAQIQPRLDPMGTDRQAKYEVALFKMLQVMCTMYMYIKPYYFMSLFRYRTTPQ